MENTMTTPVRGYCAVAALKVRVLVPTAEPRTRGGVRLLADGDLLIVPSGPPLID